MDTLELLNFYNKWWQTNKVPEELYQEFKKDICNYLVSELPFGLYPRIISLVGLRRTGKTTLLYQLINHLLDNEVPAKRILFINISDPLIANNLTFLEKLLEDYQQNVIKENFDRLSEPVYLFFDEVQYLPQWELFLKRLYEQKFKIKYIITGSGSLKIVKKTRESLVGRIAEYKVFPFTFNEFIKFKESKNRSLQIISLLDNVRIGRLRKSDFFSIYFLLQKYHSFPLLGKKLMERKLEFINLHKQLVILLNEHMEKGGFPEIIATSGQEIGYRYLIQDILDRTLTQDIPQFAQVRDPSLLQTLLIMAAQHSGSTFSYDSISKDTGARIETIRNYFQYLSSSFLISVITKFRKSEIAKFKSKKKFYIADLGIRNAIMKLSKQSINSLQNKGINAETVTVNFLLNHVLSNSGMKISFWHDGKYEVDIIIKFLEQIIPIEVKYRNIIEDSQIKGLKKFIDIYKTGGGIVITDSLINFRENIVYLPLWLFLLFF